MNAETKFKKAAEKLDLNFTGMKRSHGNLLIGSFEDKNGKAYEMCTFPAIKTIVRFLQEEMKVNN